MCEADLNIYLDWSCQVGQDQSKFIRVEHGIWQYTRSIVTVLPIATARDFGPATANEFIKMELFNPDQSWTPVLEE